MNNEQTIILITSFLPCMVILLLLLNGTRKLPKCSKWYTIFLLVHSFAVLLYLNMITIQVLLSYNIAFTSIDIYQPLLLYNSFIEHVLFCIVMLSILILQRIKLYQSRSNYYFLKTQSYFIPFTIFMLISVAIYVVIIYLSDYILYILPSLMGLSVILYFILFLNLFYRPSKRMMYYHQINLYDLPESKDLLPHQCQVELLVNGWIMRNIKNIFIPNDIQSICCNYLCDHAVSTYPIKGDAWYYHVKFHGFVIHIYDKYRIDTVSNEICMYFITGIMLFIYIILYYSEICILNIINYENVTIINGLHIGLYICLFMEILCIILALPANECLYNICCFGCKYCSNYRLIKILANKMHKENPDQIRERMLSLTPSIILYPTPSYQRIAYSRS